MEFCDDVDVNVNHNRPMNSSKQTLVYPLGDHLPEVGATLEVAPGVRWLRMPLPFELDHINLWLLADELNGVQGWTVVDCGIDDANTRAHWETLFATALEGRPILRVIATHMHPDHLGLAHWLCARWQVPLWISAAEYLAAAKATHSPDAASLQNASDFCRSHGLSDQKAIEHMHYRNAFYAQLTPRVPPCYVRLQAGDTLTIGGARWRCIGGFGHSPEHMALACEERGLLIGGDMMLPRISTNVSVYETEPLSNPVQQFLDSIDQLAPLAEETLTLPSHGKPFRGLHHRIQQLHQHHQERLAELEQACAERALCAVDALGILFKRPLDDHQLTFAFGEAVAHLHALWYAHRVERQKDSIGVFRFKSQVI